MGNWIWKSRPVIKTGFENPDQLQDFPEVMDLKTGFENPDQLNGFENPDQKKTGLRDWIWTS